jgi:hypothetical protein
MKVIEHVVAPDLGETLARASARAQCEALGYSDDTITPIELESLLAKLEKGMRVFVGGPRATVLLKEIRENVTTMATGEEP